MFGKLVTLPTKTFGKFHVVCTGVVDKGEGEGVFPSDDSEMFSHNEHIS